MLGAPGGLFLDVKSAYSSAGDLQLFVAALAGIGVNVKVPLHISAHQVAITLLAADATSGLTTTLTRRALWPFPALVSSPRNQCRG